MNGGDGQFQSEPSWKQLYEAALLELEPNLLPQRIADAQKAIERAWALLRADGNNNPEKEALAGAQVILDDLKRIYRTAGRTA